MTEQEAGKLDLGDVLIGPSCIKWEVIEIEDSGVRLKKFFGEPLKIFKGFLELEEFSIHPEREEHQS